MKELYPLGNFNRGDILKLRNNRRVRVVRNTGTKVEIEYANVREYHSCNFKCVMTILKAGRITKRNIVKRRIAEIRKQGVI